MTLKLLINGRLLNHPDVGLGVYAARMLGGLSRHARDTDVVCLAPAGCLFSFPPGIQVVQLPVYRLPRLMAETAFDWAVDRIARSHFPDHILFHPGPTAFASRPGQTCVVYHDCIPFHYPVYLGKKVIRRLLSRRCDAVARRCGLVLTVSEFSRQDIISHLGVSPDRICVVNNWLPPDYNYGNAQKYADAVRSKYQLPPRFWLYIGGYDIRKNIEFLLHAYAIAKQKTDCPPLVLVGRIPEIGAYAHCDVHKARSDLHLRVGQEIRLPGFITPEDMPGLYGATELLIYPSRYEGFGLPVMESMGCGCPAICGDTTSMPEVVKDVSYRFNTLLPEQLTSLLSRAAAKALPLNPSFSESDFSEKTAISRLLEHVRQAVATNGSLVQR